MSSSNFIKSSAALLGVLGQLLILGRHEILCSEFTKKSLEKNALIFRRENENARISLAFVFDRTGSMYDDLVQVRAGAAQILNTTIENGENAVKNYILVPFRDPDVGPAFQTEDPMKFLKALNEIYVRGGKDCPEMSVTAIKQALQLSLPGSVVYVFTDAEAKDHRVLPDVIQLIREKEIRVNFVLTGTCRLKPHESLVGPRTYETIATASSGQIVNLNKSEVNRIWKFVELSISSKRKSIFSGDKLTQGKHTYVVLVRPLLDQIIVTASAENVQLTIRDGGGRLVYPGDSGVEELFRVRSSVSVLIKNPEAGNWSFTVDSINDRQMLRVEGISGRWREVRGKHTVVVISETDECEIGVHNCKVDEKCENIPNGFRCEKQCARGFQKTTQGDCIDVDECFQPRTQLCRRGRHCVNTFGSYRCESNCPGGFKRRGAHDCTDINECLENSQVCGRRKCVNTQGSYRCEIKCQRGFKREQDGVCADINECSQNSRVCGDRQCINTRGSYRCEVKCQKGFRRSRDAVCIDINECLEQSGLCQYTCQNTAGSFQCLCPRGTRLDTDNFTCLRIKTCHGRGRCQYRCNHDTGRCECPQGYRLHWDEISCIDINECLTGEHICGGGRECFNTLGKYHCLNLSCPQGYFLNRDRYCTKQCSHYTEECPGQYSIVRHCAVSIPCYLPPNTDFLYLEPYIPQMSNIYQSLVCYCAVYFYPVQGKQHIFGVYNVADVGALYNRVVFDKPGFYELQVVSDYLNGYGNVISRTTFHVFLDVSDHPF